MNLINAIILGLVEGITEFLPISSTAHLIVASKFLKIPQTDFQKFFEVFIQSGAILAVAVLYFQYVLKNKNIIKPVIFSFFPTAIVGLVLYKIIKKLFFESFLLIILAIGFVGIIFILVEYLLNKKKHDPKKLLKSISVRDSIIIGFTQSIAVIPGVSRSGIVMVAMMSMGYRRDESATYSFLLAAPTIFAASIFDFFKMRTIIMGSSITSIQFLIVGFTISFIVAYFSMKWLIRFLQKNTLNIFGIYRIGLAIMLLFFFN